MSDVRNAAERLRKLLRATQFPQLQALDLEAGAVADLLRVLHFVLLDSSRAVAQFLVDKGYDLYGKTDARFVESSFRLLRDEFRCFPTLSPAQFLSNQFVARRLNLVADAAAAVAQKRQELQRHKRRQEAVWSQPQSRPRRASVENHVLPAAVVNQAANILQQLQVQDETQRAETAPLPAPSFRARTVDDRSAPSAVECGRVKSGVDDGVQTEDALMQKTSCSCAQDSDALRRAIGDLSRQLNEVSSALMGKMSSVESRLDRLETHVHGVQIAVEEQRELARESNVVHQSGVTERLKSGGDDKNGEQVDTQRTLDAEAPCAWPPQPSVFERY